MQVLPPYLLQLHYGLLLVLPAVAAQHLDLVMAVTEVTLFYFLHLLVLPQVLLLQLAVVEAVAMLRQQEEMD